MATLLNQPTASPGRCIGTRQRVAHLLSCIKGCIGNNLIFSSIVPSRGCSHFCVYLCTFSRREHGSLVKSALRILHWATVAISFQVHHISFISDTVSRCQVSRGYRLSQSLVAFFSDLGWRCCFEVLTNPTPFTSFDENFYWHLSCLDYSIVVDFV